MVQLITWEDFEAYIYCKSFDFYLYKNLENILCLKTK